jgi:hypothetical protein
LWTCACTAILRTIQASAVYSALHCSAVRCSALHTCLSVRQRRLPLFTAQPQPHACFTQRRACLQAARQACLEPQVGDLAWGHHQRPCRLCNQPAAGLADVAPGESDHGRPVQLLHRVARHQVLLAGVESAGGIGIQPAAAVAPQACLPAGQYHAAGWPSKRMHTDCMGAKAGRVVYGKAWQVCSISGNVQLYVEPAQASSIHPASTGQPVLQVAHSHDDGVVCLQL